MLKGITIEKAKQNLQEIIELSKNEIEIQDENVTAVLDLKDLTSLSVVLAELERLKEGE